MSFVVIMCQISNFKIDSAKCENPVYPELVKLPTATKVFGVTSR